MKKTCIMTLALLLTVVMTAQAGSLIVIANKGVGVSSLSRAQVQNIFLGKDVLWPDGKKMNPAVLKGGATHDKFLDDVLGKSAAQFDSFWKKAIFTGTGRPPKTVGGEADMVQYVAGTDGGVGYIDSDTSHGDVKKIDVR